MTATTEAGTDRPTRYIESVIHEGERFARTADAGELHTPIVACPGWTMRELVRHLGEIHLWAAANVAFPSPRWLNVADLSELAGYWPDLASEWPADTELVEWYRATHANLVCVLETAPVGVEAFTFLPAPSPLTMWARRQASEIAVHRFDAEQALGRSSDFAPTFAADMLDELLSGFAPLNAGLESAEVLCVDAIDVGARWWVSLGPRRVTASSTGDHADLVISGMAADLYLAMWNRTPIRPPQLQGDASVLDLWRRTCRVEWSR